MLRDASHQQVIQKFSFIESLNSSRHKSPSSESPVNRVDRQQTVSDLALAVKTKSENEASAIVNTASTINADWYQGDSSSYSLNWAEVINSAADNSVNHNQPQNHNYLGKILFALATSYSLFALWWLFGHQASKALTELMGGKQVILTQSEVQFIDYMERSLSRIDRQLEAKREAASDVVYVPVYTPTPATPQIPQLAGGHISSMPTSSKTSSASISPSSQALKIPSPPPLPAPVPLDENEDQTNQLATAKPKIKHTLIGILELGADNSAALVQVKGQTRRIWLGEAINSEGWILESVGNQRATISHHGQTRSIAVGETF